jgi:RND family efflux transporter MFP subunit
MSEPPRSSVALWKQGIGVVIVVGLAAVLAGLFVPASHPLLDRAGLLGPLARLGLVASAQVDAAGQQGGPPGVGGSPGAQARGGPNGGGVRVLAEPAAPQVLNDLVTAIGSARGESSVVLSSEVSGRILSLEVASGDYVEAGDIVAELDSEEARFAVERATLVLRDAEATLRRVEQLRTTGAATELQAQEAQLALRTAELELREAEYALSRHQVAAPISGWVGILQVEPGNRVTSDTEITRIEDRSSLIVDFRVPERIVGKIKPGDPLTATPLADPGLDLPGKILAIDNRVDEASRSLLVQASIENAEDRLRAGMAFRIALSFDSDPHPAVDPLAIQWGSSGAFVWVVRDGKAERLPIRILQRNADTVLIDAETRPGDLIVTQGVQSLRPGGEVSVVDPTGAPIDPQTKS